MPLSDGKNGGQSEESPDHSAASSSSSSSSSSGDRTSSPYSALRTSRNVRLFAKKYRTEIAASTASLFSTFLTFPLDFTKSRMQSYGTNFLHTVKDAYKTEGGRAFWRGVAPPLVSVTFVRTISFSVYQRAKYSYDKIITDMTGQSPLMLANKPGGYPTVLTIACFGAAGATAGAAITTLSCPFELTKLNEQLAGKEARQGSGNTTSSSSTKPPRSSSWATARRLVRDRGFAGLYSGYRLHFLRDTIGTCLYFMTYESTKQLMANAKGKSPTNPYAVVVAGGMCGIVSWTCIYPIDVAKTVYQRALLSAGSGTAERPKIKFFEPGAYRGLGVSVTRSCIINAVFFSIFEFLKGRINALEA